LEGLFPNAVAFGPELGNLHTKGVRDPVPRPLGMVVVIDDARNILLAGTQLFRKLDLRHVSFRQNPVDLVVESHQFVMVWLLSKVVLDINRNPIDVNKK